MIERATLLFLTVLCSISCYGTLLGNGGSERKQLFDDNWKFALGEYSSASAVDFDDVRWRALDLPHDWSIEGNIDRKNPTGAAGATSLRA